MEPLLELTESQLANAFNEWMRRYIDEPERFEREFESVRQFEAEANEGTPSYGADCAAYLLKMHQELTCNETQQSDAAPAAD
jgi:hypothetical protein